MQIIKLSALCYNSLNTSSWFSSTSIRFEKCGQHLSRFDGCKINEKDIKNISKIQCVNKKIHEMKENLVTKSDTVKLMAPMHAMKAERTGKWKMHLNAIKQMLPCFASAGHNNYTKSVYLYLQKWMKWKKLLYTRNALRVTISSEEHMSSGLG